MTAAGTEGERRAVPSMAPLVAEKSSGVGNFKRLTVEDQYENGMADDLHEDEEELSAPKEPGECVDDLSFVTRSGGLS